MFDETSVWPTVLLILLLPMMLIAHCSCSQAECASICVENGAESAWKFTQGCYCKDSEGVYNPKDSRDR